MKILGISAFYHDAAAALIMDGQIVAAAQEERFSRTRHDARFPLEAAAYCLRECRCSPDDLDYVVFYEKPLVKFERLLETYLAAAPSGFRSFAVAMPLWVKDRLFQKRTIIRELRSLGGRRRWHDRLLFSEHHLSHAASAFYPSPFQRAAILTLDGVGEWSTTTLAIGSGNEIETLKEIRFPHSLGMLYSAFTYYTGFKVNSGEYKMMGLAPYGVPKYVDVIRDNLIDVKPDGSFALDQRYFDYCTGFTMTNDRFHDLFGGPPRVPESPITQRDMDLAASAQAVIEEVVVKIAHHIARSTGERNLCMAGGVALNCVANGRLLREKIFDNIWIQPAPGDAGGARGAALAAYHLMLARPRQTCGTRDGMKGAYLGPAFSQQDIESRLTALGARFDTLDDAKLIDTVARALAQGQAVGWHQGRMEFGPRALGARSILGDARSPTMQRLLNLKVKFRESFRPFAPSVLREDVADWFDLDCDSPYMLLVANVCQTRRLPITEEDAQLIGLAKLHTSRSSIPAVTHVDFSARIHTVHAETNPRYHALLTRFKELTGVPVLVNTSFNVRGEPIVCTPEDAYRCFMNTAIELLVIGNCLLTKAEQPHAPYAAISHQVSAD